MVKNALGEGLATSVGPQVSGEACGEGQGSLAGSGDLAPTTSMAEPRSRWGQRGHTRHRTRVNSDQVTC